MPTPIFLGIAGPSGAGKTTLARHLCSRHPQITHVKLDAFFKNVSEFPYYRHWLNREVPDNLYWDEFYSALRQLRAGQPANFPIYDREKGVRAGYEQITPSAIVLVEGYLLFFDPRIRDLFDVRLYLNVSTQEQYRRKKIRWPEMDDDYFFEVVVPTFEMHGKHGARHAHALINGDQGEPEVVAEAESYPIVNQFLVRAPAVPAFK